MANLITKKREKDNQDDCLRQQLSIIVHGSFVFI